MSTSTILSRCGVSSGAILIGVVEPNYASVRIQIGVAASASAKMMIGVDSGAIGPPRNVLMAHLGSGAVALQWDAPLVGTASYYEVYASGSENGTYIRYLNGRFAATRGVLYNIPLGTTLYLKVRAVSTAGVEGAFAQAERGTFGYPSVPMTITGIENSVIADASRFAMLDRFTGRILAFETESEITLEE